MQDEFVENSYEAYYSARVWALTVIWKGGRRKKRVATVMYEIPVYDLKAWQSKYNYVYYVKDGKDIVEFNNDEKLAEFVVELREWGFFMNLNVDDEL